MAADFSPLPIKPLNSTCGRCRAHLRVRQQLVTQRIRMVQAELHGRVLFLREVLRCAQYQMTGVARCGLGQGLDRRTVRRPPASNGCRRAQGRDRHRSDRAAPVAQRVAKAQSAATSSSLQSPIQCVTRCGSARLPVRPSWVAMTKAAPSASQRSRIRVQHLVGGARIQAGPWAHPR